MRLDDVSGYCTEINGVKYTGWFGESSDNFPPRILKPLKLVSPEEFIAMFGDPTEDIPDYPPEIAALAKAAEPLRDYLLERGDPHTCAVVTQLGVTLKRDEIGVAFAKHGGSDRSTEFEREIKDMMEGLKNEFD